MVRLRALLVPTEGPVVRLRARLVPTEGPLVGRVPGECLQNESKDEHRQRRGAEPADTRPPVDFEEAAVTDDVDHLTGEDSPGEARPQEGVVSTAGLLHDANRPTASCNCNRVRPA